MKDNKRIGCAMRHDNGNCLPCGGFCTAVNDSICEALHNAFRHGESEERDRLVLSMIDANAKYQERQLEVLRNIHERVVGDTVAVVRCKDCTNYHEFISGYRCVHFNGGDGRAYQTSPDDFCSYGERKDNGKG